MYGNESQHYENFRKLIDSKDFTNIHSGHYIHVCEIQGLLKAIEHEFTRGLIVDFKNLVQASIFADFLEVAEYLLSEGYKDSAAVMIGAVLEDSLRKLAEGNSILTQLPSRPLSINPLNIELARASVYGPLVQKQVTTWADLRNSAAHGHYDKCDNQQVKQMLLFVQKFCSDYLQ